MTPLPAPPLAVFSEDRVYRYTLRRHVSPMLGSGTCTMIQCNPSKADEHRNDPTVRRNIDFVTSWGFEWLVQVNVFALCSTDPAELKRTSLDPVGPLNDGYIWSAVEESDLAVCAWGNNGALNGRSQAILARLLPHFAGKMRHLGLTNIGEPGHTLYLPKVTQLQEFSHAV